MLRYQAVLPVIAVGISGLIIVSSMGDAIEKKISNSFELLVRATVLRAGWDFEKRPRWHQGDFREKDLDDLSILPGLASVTAIVQKPDQTFAHKARRAQGRLMGVEDNFFATLNFSLSKGRPIDSDDVKAVTHTCILGRTISAELFAGGQIPLGESIALEGLGLTVIGVLGGVEDRDYDRTVLVPISVTRKHFTESYKISSIYIRAVNWHVVEELRELVAQVLKRNHSEFSDTLEIRYYPEKLLKIQSMEVLVKLLLYTGLFTTLALAGLGIASLMLLSVQERTPEIGLRKALGAKDTDILGQFLIEAATISFAGAACGLLFGLLLVAMMAWFLQMNPNYGHLIWAVVGAFVSGIGLGLVAGTIPARKASMLDPVEALRFE